MPTLVHERSRITAKGQTTIPQDCAPSARRELRGEIEFMMDEGVRVDLLGSHEKSDPVIDGILAFLARDMAHNPSHIAAVPPALAERLSALTAGMDVDLDEEVDDAVML